MINGLHDEHARLVRTHADIETELRPGTLSSHARVRQHNDVLTTQCGSLAEAITSQREVLESQIAASLIDVALSAGTIPA